MVLRLCAEARNVCYVNDDGTLNWNNCNYSNGVRPFWWIVLTLSYSHQYVYAELNNEQIKTLVDAGFKISPNSDQETEGYIIRR